VSTKVAREPAIQLRIPSTQGVRVSRRAFERLCRANPDLRMGRSANGELWVMAPAGSETGSRNAGLTAQLWTWNRDRGLGVDFDSSGGFTLPNGMIHAPDAAWIANERWEALSPAHRKTFARISSPS
jgi:Uma2 family endonuclease